MMQIRVTSDQADEITAEQLRISIDEFKANLRDHNFRIFDNDLEKDVKKIKKYIKAFNLVRSWYVYE
jgi:hypothetical protein